MAAGAPSGASLLASSAQTAAARRKVTFPKGAVIRTLLKDLPPESLTNGATLFHEHFPIDLPPITPPPPNATPPPPTLTKDLNLMIEEAKGAAKDGIACIVDGGHNDMGRDLEFLKQLTTRSGLPIVASGGYFADRVHSETSTGGSQRGNPPRDHVRQPQTVPCVRAKEIAHRRA